MAFKVIYKSSVHHDLKHLDKDVAGRILREIEVKLSKDSRAGEALKGEFRGLYKLRVGDYRVIYTEAGDVVIVLRIRHRGKAYS